ncbi:MAG: ECF transporter S component [Defluviitaleaceae bacterium]|nr:ECF transporter S component [Defluviitaleaceae bacterium]
MNQTTKKLCVLAMICAVAFILAAIVRVPVVLFLRYDPKDVVIAIAGFLYGPMAALMVAVVVAVVQMFTVSQTGPIGLLMNIIASAAFCCTAAFIYKKKRTMSGAVIGLAVATLFATIVMMLWNYIITPIFMDVPRQAVVGLLLSAFLPFNLISNTLNAAFTLLLYKPIKSALQASNLMPAPETTVKGKINIGIIVGSGFAILTCILWVMVLQGYI